MSVSFMDRISARSYASWFLGFFPLYEFQTMWYVCFIGLNVNHMFFQGLRSLEDIGDTSEARRFKIDTWTYDSVWGSCHRHHSILYLYLCFAHTNSIHPNQWSSLVEIWHWCLPLIPLPHRRCEHRFNQVLHCACLVCGIDDSSIEETFNRVK